MNIKRTSPSLVERDAAVSWHPYTQHGIEVAPLPVSSAKGSVITLEDGTEIIDAISSWWAILHGHGELAIAQAMADQALRLDHVLFAGATHEPAVRLAERLVEVTPEGLTRVFYSDDGSTAIEVALKMVIQFWQHQDQGQRRVFVGLEHAYHGDTFGAMAIGDPDPFFEPFRELLFGARLSAPNIKAITATLDELGDTAAGVILEPLVQGAGGMLMQSPAFLRELRALCTARDLPLIADEVMTGFGRTGKLFACDVAGIAPDLMCLAKGLTGGMTPMSVTMASERFFECFVSQDRGAAFFHGHTFTAHPIGCAAALASLELTLSRDVPAVLDKIGARIESKLREHLWEFGAEPSGASKPRVLGLRRQGGIVAFDLAHGEQGYLASQAPVLRQAATARGVLLRPLGNILYAMPPASTTVEQCDRIAEVLVELVEVASA
jgi:adenosylmethionine---8-amino-7-oxononanoate aminotransferase